MFRGTFTALVTPFREDGALDETALARLVERQLAAGIDGLVLFGTTGEEASLSLEERRSTVELVQKQAEGHIYVVAGAFDHVTDRAVTLAREMDWLGVDAILSVVPYYVRPTPAGMIDHFRRIADTVDSPVILSNVPARAAAGLDAETVALLSEHGNIRGLDESSGDLDFLSRVLADTDEDFAVFSGEDTLALPMLALGADGVFSVVSNEAPKQMQRLVQAALDGNVSDAQEIHYELFDLMMANTVETNPIPVKAALAMMGLMDEHYRLPLTPLGDESREVVRNALDELGLLR